MWILAHWSIRANAAQGGPMGILGVNAQPVKMDLIKKSLPKQKTIQTFKVDTLGFRITIKENPPAQIFSRHFWGTSPAGNRTRAFGDLLIRSLTLYQLLHWGERNLGQKF